MTTTTPSLTTPELLTQLHDHFIKPDDTWAGAVCLTEVTAPNSNRRADLIHIGLWSSRGAGGIDVCELKTSRADFRREIDSPAKAEAWWPYSSRFWIVSPGEHVTPPEELPPGWGLMVPKTNSRRFRVIVKPAEREAKLTEQLLVTLLKCTETSRVNAVERQRDRLQREHYQQIEAVKRERAVRADPQMKERLALLDELEAALGTRLAEYAWNGIAPQQAAAALRELARGETALAKQREDLRRMSENLKNMAALLQRQSADLAKAIGSPIVPEEA